MAEKIPRRIIQTDKSRDLPLLARAAAMNLRLLNLDFEYLFFDDAEVEEFIDAEFPRYRPVIESFPVRVQRYDLFRYLAVYRFGGFYFDIDVLLASPLEDLLGFGCVFPFEHLGINRFL
jgi:mannosyltransferase OCH1-like enzyme